MPRMKYVCVDRRVPYGELVYTVNVTMLFVFDLFIFAIFIVYL